MNKNLSIFAAVAALAVLPACNDYTTPQGVVATAYNAVQKDKLKTLKKTLKGDAKEMYGHTAGLVDLQNRFKGLEVSLGKTTLDSTDKVRDRDVARYYTVELLSREQNKGEEQVEFSKEGEAKVVCDVRRRFVRQPVPGHPGYPYDSGYCRSPYGCDGYYGPYPPYYTREEESTRCWIFELI